MQIIDNLKLLATKLNLHQQSLCQLYYEHPDFPLKVPEDFLARMQKSTIDDPLLKQILPTKNELKSSKTYSIDPLHETKYSPTPGLIHKYFGRALIITTTNCPINCRFCFRRHTRPTESTPINWDRIFDYITANKTLSEIILSGGDPLILPQQKLQKIIKELAEIPHLSRLRIHSRTPIIMPKIITASLLKSISQHRLQTTLVTHCNHPNELSNNVRKTLDLCKNYNLFLLNQTVLLRNINDNSKTLIKLSEKLFTFGVLPYYLHILDKVKGAQHFQIAEFQAKKIYREMQSALPGFLVPKLVQDVVEATAKKLII